ncbi:MAG: hypothetical protein M3O09_15510 [Acidobacteriota bacterium]|nr:hypothetical protein [Acidobacteriota bacterium]
MVLLVASAKLGASETEVKRANAVIANIGLTEADQLTIGNLVSAYRGGLQDFEQQAHSMVKKGESSALNDLYLREQNLLSETILQVQTQLTPVVPEKSRLM